MPIKDVKPLQVDVQWRTSDGAGASPGTLPLGLVERLSKPKASPRTDTVDERLKRAEERRQVRRIGNPSSAHACGCGWHQEVC
jgi:hypothetical protein